MSKIVHACLFCLRTSRDGKTWPFFLRMMQLDQEEKISHGVCPDCNGALVGYSRTRGPLPWAGRRAISCP